MKALIYPSEVHGIVEIPASKSITQRVLALSMLHHGKTTIRNCGKSEDELSVISVIREMGCEVRELPHELQVTGINNIDYSGILNCGESGLALRIFAFISSLSKNEIILTGNGTLLNRDMVPLQKMLHGLNVNVSMKNGRIPISIKGPLIPADITADGSASSQYISGLMIALAYASSRPVSITLSGVVSLPYIDLTIAVMQKFGYKVERNNLKIFILPVRDTKEDIIYNVEGDWSNAAFWLVAAALNGKLHLKGLNFNTKQGDISVLDIMGQCGVTSRLEKEILIVEKPHFLYPFHCDITQNPDLFPPLVALSCYCNGTSMIKGVSRLVNKESNRAEGLVDVFTKLGVKIFINEDTMIIEGSTPNGGIINSNGDHRIAMAASVAALRSKEPVTVECAEAVRKSYPLFYDHLKSTGVNVTLISD